MDVRWHGYELRPDPVPQPDPDSDYISEHWRNRVLPMALERGLTMRVPRRKVRSRHALQAAMFARDHGRFPEMDRALYKARFEDDADISSIAVLMELAEEAGLDGDALARAVAANHYVGALNADAELAYRLGINGVPTMIVGPSNEDSIEFFADAEPVVGSVPYDWLEEAIERALKNDRAYALMRRRFRPDIKIE